MPLTLKERGGLTMPLGSRMINFVMMTSRSAGNAATAYQNSVLSLNPIAYWPLNESAGTVADNATGLAARDGSYTGVTLGNTTGPFGGTAGLWDGVNDFGNIYSASLASAFSGAEGSVSIWAKVSGSGVWTDSTTRRIVYIGVDNNNRVNIERNTSNNRIDIMYRAGATSSLTATTSLGGETGWFHLALTWNAAGDAVKAYINGSQVGSTLTGLGTWAGALTSNTCAVGAATTSATNPWSGYIAHAAVWSKELAQPAITTLYNGGPIA